MNKTEHPLCGEIIKILPSKWSEKPESHIGQTQKPNPDLLTDHLQKNYKDLISLGFKNFLSAKYNKNGTAQIGLTIQFLCNVPNEVTFTEEKIITLEDTIKSSCCSDFIKLFYEPLTKGEKFIFHGNGHYYKDTQNTLFLHLEEIYTSDYYKEHFYKPELEDDLL